MWLVGVVSTVWVWLVGGIYVYGYNIWVWLVGVVIRRYTDILTIIINFPYTPHVLGLFLAAASLLLCSFLKCFFGLVSVIFLQYIANVTHRTFEIFQKNRDPANIKII